MDRRAFLAQIPSLNPQTSELPRNINFDPAQSAAGSRAQIASTLAPWSPSQSEPWDITRINHFYRRAAFGALPLHAKLGMSLDQHLNELFDSKWTGSKLPSPPAHHEEWLMVKPYLGSEVDKQVAQATRYQYAMNAIRRQWAQEMLQEGPGLREKMVLFWMNHWVIESNKVYFPQIVYRYMKYLRENPWGNFKQMVKDITIQPAMLFYLDGYISYRTRPNENYARELLELFTMGVTDKNGNPNYTEKDIKEIARSLTGYRIDFTAEDEVLKSFYDVTWHDASFKEPFGAQKKNYGLASSGASVVDVIDLIFEHRSEQIAWFMAHKLYQFFIYHSPSTPPELAVVRQIADLLRTNNWEMKPVIRAILSSEHFFDTANIGAGIKSPVEYVIGGLRNFGVDTVNPNQAGTLMVYAFLFEQTLLDPPNVKGWLGGHAWVSTTTLPLRNTSYAVQLTTLRQLTAFGSTGYGQDHEDIIVDDAMLTAWAKGFASYSGTFDAFFAELAQFISPLMPSDRAKTTIVQPKLPPNYYEWPSLSDTEKIAPLRIMIRELMLLAEYQLN